MLSVIIPN